MTRFSSRPETQTGDPSVPDAGPSCLERIPRKIRGFAGRAARFRFELARHERID